MRTSSWETVGGEMWRTVAYGQLRLRDIYMRFES